MRTYKDKFQDQQGYIKSLHDHIEIIGARARNLEKAVIEGVAHPALVQRCSEYEQLIEACYQLITTGQESMAHRAILIMRTEIELRKEFK